MKVTDKNLVSSCFSLYLEKFNKNICTWQYYDIYSDVIFLLFSKIIVIKIQWNLLTLRIIMGKLKLGLEW